MNETDLSQVSPLEAHALQVGALKSLELMRLGRNALLAVPVVVLVVFTSLKIYVNYFAKGDAIQFLIRIVSFFPRFDANQIQLRSYFKPKTMDNIVLYYISLIIVLFMVPIFYLFISKYLAYESKFPSDINFKNIKKYNKPYNKFIVIFILSYYFFTKSTKNTSIIGLIYNNGIILSFDLLFVSSILMLIFGFSLRYWTIRRFKEIGH